MPDNSIRHLGHSAVALKLDGRVLIFDFPYGTTALDETELRPMEPNEVSAEDVYFFASHGHGDHFRNTIYTWKGKARRVTYILPPGMTRMPEGAIVVGPGQTVEVAGMKVRGYPSTDAGVAFSVYLGGKHIYFAGDNGFWNWEGKRDEADYIAKNLATVDRTTPIDIAFQVCDPKAAGVGDGGVGAFALAFQPRLLVPIHLRGQYDFLADIDRRLKDRGFKGRFWPVKAPGDTLQLER